MEYTLSEEKNFKDYFRLTNSAYSFPFKTPQMCPICGMGQGGIVKEGQFFNAIDVSYFFATFTCTECHRVYGLIFDTNKSEQYAKFKAFHPTVEPTYNDDILEACSPRYVKMYRQALMAEYRGQCDIAAIGYRTALEMLIKDYAINECGASPEDVANKKLAKSIQTYLVGEESSAAEVVRLLGNDYAHYIQVYPDVEFEVLKEYMDIFIAQIRVKLRLAHPPTQTAEDSLDQK